MKLIMGASPSKWGADWKPVDRFRRVGKGQVGKLFENGRTSKDSPYLIPFLGMPLALTIWLHALMIVVVTYLLGSIPSGYLLMRFFRKQDIRTIGSGNIGATNVMRSGARGLGAATFLFDFLKGSLAVLVGARLASVGFPAFQLHYAEALAAVCVVLGHMFPIWLGLRGGKEVATAFGAFVILVPLASAGGPARLRRSLCIRALRVPWLQSWEQSRSLPLPGSPRRGVTFAS